MSPLGRGLLWVALAAASCTPANAPLRDRSAAPAALASTPPGVDADSVDADSVDAALAIEPLDPPGIALLLRPDGVGRRVTVELVAFVDAARRFLIEDLAGGKLLTATARDSTSTIDIVRRTQDPGVVLELAREPRGPVRIRYQLEAASDVDSMEPGTLAVDPTRMRLPGSVLALPAELDPLGVHLRLSIDAATLQYSGVASSFGARPTDEPQHDLQARGREIRDAVYLGGVQGRALFDTTRAHDEAVWLGALSFDPRPVATDFAMFRQAAGEYLRARDPVPLTLVLSGDVRPTNQYIATTRASSIVLHLGAGQPYSGDLRITLATAYLQRWLGRMLWIGAADAELEATSFWFTEGVTRYLARELLFRMGYLRAAEYLAEINGLLAITATSKHRALGNRALSELAPETGRMPLIVARGALYASDVNARIRAHEKSAELGDTIRQLLRDAIDKKSALPTTAWLQAVSRATGRDEQPAFDRWIEAGAPPKLPNNAFGKCFRATNKPYFPFELGFDGKASNRYPRQIRGLVTGGTADRAGVQEGDEILRLRYRDKSSEIPVELRVKRGDKEHDFGYRPAGPPQRGQGFVRVPKIPDLQCF